MSTPRADLTPAERIEWHYRTAVLDAQIDDAIAPFFGRWQAMPPDEQAVWRLRVRDVWFHADTDWRGRPGNARFVRDGARRLLDLMDSRLRAVQARCAPKPAPQRHDPPTPARTTLEPLTVQLRTVTVDGRATEDVDTGGRL